MSDDGVNRKAFDFAKERKNREVNLGIEEHKKGEGKESAGEKNEKEAKVSCSFKRAEEENQTRTSKESSKKIWSNSAQNIKEADLQDNTEITSSTRPTVKYKERHNIPVKGNKINVTQKTNNIIMRYNETKI